MEDNIKKGNVQDLRKFFGILSKETGDELERNIKRMRRLNRKTHKERMERIRKMFND